MPNNYWQCWRCKAVIPSGNVHYCATVVTPAGQTNNAPWYWAQCGHSHAWGIPCSVDAIAPMTANPPALVNFDG